MENKRTNPLTCRGRWMYEGADLRSYVAGCVRSGTAHQKHTGTCFVRAFSALTDMRSEKHSHLTYCSWLTSNNDAFTHILDDTHQLWCTHFKNTRIHCLLYDVSGSSCCEWNCIFTHSVRHAGLPRDRNTNLGVLASETM